MQMIPAVRAFLSTSWDPTIRQDLAKKRGEAAVKAVKNAGRPAGMLSKKEYMIGTVIGEASTNGEGGASGGGNYDDVGGGG
jgi:hypothetical protein